jgi:hypothetical protein
MQKDKQLQEGLYSWQTKKLSSGRVQWQVLYTDKGKTKVLSSGVSSNILDANRKGKEEFNRQKMNESKVLKKYKIGGSNIEIKQNGLKIEVYLDGKLRRTTRDLKDAESEVKNMKFMHSKRTRQPFMKEEDTCEDCKNEDCELHTLDEAFHSAAPAAVGGNLQPIGKRNPNTIAPKFAMLLKDIDEHGDTVLRLLVTYANGESLVLPPAGEPGCSDGDELLVKVLDCIGSDEETIRVITGALDRSRKMLSEESITDRYQKMVIALNVLKSPVEVPPNTPASMTKLEAIGVLRDMNIPDEKAMHALLQSGASQEEIEELFQLARLGIS